MSNIRAHGLDLARASARSTGKFLAVLLVALCALMIGTHDAYAITVRDDGDGYKRAIVYPHDYPNGRAAALAEFLGYDWDSFSTQTKNAILGDNGKFKQLLDNNVSNYRYENQDNVGHGSLVGAWTTMLVEVVNSVSETIFGNDKTWFCYCTNADYDAARENIEQWLYPNDGTNGGNGGNENIDGLNIYTLNKIQNVNRNITNYASADISVINGRMSITNMTNGSNYEYGDSVQVAVDTYMEQELESTSNIYNANIDKKIIAYGNNGRYPNRDNGIYIFGYDSTKIAMSVVNNKVTFTKLSNEQFIYVPLISIKDMTMVNGVIYPYGSAGTPPTISVI